MDDAEGFLDYIRLTVLLNDGTILLRAAFRDLYKKLTQQDWEDTPQCGQKFITSLGRNYHKQAQKMQKELLQNGDVNKWDITILKNLITSLTSNFSEDDFNSKFKKNKLKSLKALADVRNKHAHLADKSVSKAEFSVIWNTLRNALVELGGDSQEYNKIENATNFSGISFKTSEMTIEESMIRVRKLREDGNLAFKNQTFGKAITIYSEALNINGISDVERGLLFSNRSYSYLKSLDKVTCDKQIKEGCSQALEDAKSVVELRPTWWKGYYRLGLVYQFQKEWKSAVIAFNRALGLDPAQVEVKSCRDECRYEANKDKIEQHLDPRTQPRSLVEDINNIVPRRKKLGDSVEATADKIMKMNENFMKSKDPELFAKGCVFFGHRHVQGVDVPLNYEMAVLLYSKAAATGNAEGIYNLGLLYLWGKGVKKDLNRAVNLFEQAAKLPIAARLGGIQGIGLRNLGVAEAQYQIGNCYRDGVGKSQNYDEAVKWYTRSCDNGYGDAANNLAFMYRDGLGVPTDNEKAVQLWTVAANRGVVMAMESLAWECLNVGSPDEAEVWFQRSIDGGNLYSMMNKERFEVSLATLKNDLKEMQSSLGLDETYNSITKCREAGIQQLPEGQNLVKIFENLELCHKREATLPSVSTSDSHSSLAIKIWECQEEIESKSQDGQLYPFAQKLRSSTNSFMNGRKLLSEYVEDNRQMVETKHMIVSEFASCFRGTEIVTCFSPFLKAELQKIVNEIQISNKGKNKIDLDARICHSYLNMNYFEEVFEFLEMSKLKYPDEICFYDLYCSVLGWQGKYEEGKKITSKFLKLFPNNVKLLYSRAVMMRLGLEEMSNYEKVHEVMSAYLDFLKFAPRDHRKVPEAFYCLSMMTLYNGKGEVNQENFVSPEALKFYENGLKSEQNLVSCFRPYDSSMKLLFETRLSALKMFQNVSSSAEEIPPSSSSSTGTNVEEPEERIKIPKLQLTNPIRVDIVVRYRRNLAEYLSIAKCKRAVRKTTESLHQQTAPSKLTSLRDISLSQMMSENKDHVYKNFVLNVTIMEDCLFGFFPSIHTVVCDEKGDFQKCYIYNLDHDDKDKRRALSFGSTLSIMNPYFRLTADSGTGIKVEDPKSLFFHTSGMDVPKCRFCGGPNADKACARCKRVKYCSKKCQEEDWKRLKHKFICDIKFTDM